MSSSKNLIISKEDIKFIKNCNQEMWIKFVTKRDYDYSMQNKIIRAYNGKLTVFSLKSKQINLFKHYIKSMGEIGKNIKPEIEETRFRMISRQGKGLNSDIQMRNYGLVVGRIQSGKTGHMLGLSLLCLSEQHLQSIKIRSKKKPASIVILLSSLIDDIRIQTYNRLMRNLSIESKMQLLIGPNSNDDLTKDKNFQNELVGFLESEKNGLQQSILVIKKNHEVLETLSEIFQKTQNPTKRNLNDVIIIDDECDYASLDSNHADQDLTQNETTTNRLLRELILNIRTRFHCVCWYIGYTATPFANILENPHGLSHDGLPTLFPRGFIHSLKKIPTHIDNSYYFSDLDACKHIFLDNGISINPSIPEEDE